LPEGAACPACGSKSFKKEESERSTNIIQKKQWSKIISKFEPLIKDEIEDIEKSAKFHN